MRCLTQQVYLITELLRGGALLEAVLEKVRAPKPACCIAAVRLCKLLPFRGVKPPWLLPTLWY